MDWGDPRIGRNTFLFKETDLSNCLRFCCLLACENANENGSFEILEIPILSDQPSSNKHRKWVLTPANIQALNKYATDGIIVDALPESVGHTVNLSLENSEAIYFAKFQGHNDFIEILTADGSTQIIHTN